MTDLNNEAAKQQIGVVLEHVATRLAQTRAAYLAALDDALQFVIDEATQQGRSTKLAPAACFMGVPGESIMSRFDTDGHLTTWVADRSDATYHRLNRIDLVQAAARLGLLDRMPEIKGKTKP